MRDQLLTRITALPAAAATSAPAGLDLKVFPRVGPVDGNAQFRLSCPATPALVDAKTIIWTFEDSADNATFTAIPGVATHTTLGAGGAGAAAFDILRPIPKETRRYVRCTAAVLTAGGSNIAVSYTFSVDFHTVI